MFEAISQTITTPPVQGQDGSLATQGGAPKSSETQSAQKTADLLSASAQAAQAEKKTQEQAQQQVTEKMLRELEQDIEAIHSVGLRFAKFEELDRTYIKVIDKTNDEVIRQIPSEEVLKLAAKLEEMIGILFDKQA
jgi:flagellar protein FlaG